MKGSIRQTIPWRLSWPPSNVLTQHPRLNHGFRSRHPHNSSPLQRRHLLTLAIETSCDDTCVAILEKSGPCAKLLFNKKITSDNRQYGGIHPNVAVESHTASLASLIQEALSWLPLDGPRPRQTHASNKDDAIRVPDLRGISSPAVERRKPDLISVTRGPGMTPSLSTGLNTAKGLAVAWQVPLLGVNHMQAHALTPRLVSGLRLDPKDYFPPSRSPTTPSSITPAFPFLSLLVSGGHTLLVLSQSIAKHRILAQTPNIAIGDVLDKAARAILPPGLLASQESTMYGPLLERFAFPNGVADYAGSYYAPPRRRRDEIAPFVAQDFGWQLEAPLAGTRAMRFDFSSFNGAVLRIAAERQQVADGGSMSDAERVLLARETMRLAFEHLASRVVFALSGEGVDSAPLKKQMEDVKTLVVSGGVASNKFLMHLLRAFLDARGFERVGIVAPPAELCTDNAAMIAWTGLEMFEAGWRTGLGVLAKRKWPIDPEEEGGILGTDGWINVAKES